MARVTVEDCIDKVDSPYELVLVAKERATQLNSGIEPTLEKDNDKNTVISLREIAEENIKVQDLIEDETRSTYIFNVKTNLSSNISIHGIRNVPGGQLVQATDNYVGVLKAGLKVEITNSAFNKVFKGKVEFRK